MLGMVNKVDRIRNRDISMAFLVLAIITWVGEFNYISLILLGVSIMFFVVKDKKYALHATAEPKDL